jgi:3',5'-cyclic AMP phosphodiesterase CpdA
MRIGVLSDLHAYAGDPPPLPPSLLNTRLPEDQPAQHPFVGLAQLIGSEKLSADLLVCGGDMGDKANPEGIAWAWQWIHRIAHELGADRVIATSGNHDVDSRYIYTDHDAKGVLQSLNPPYPSSDEAMNDRYWARNLVVDTIGDVRFVVLNSAAYHGVGEEWEHGRISLRTLAYLKKALDASAPATANVLLCHHHPFRFGDIDLADYSEMKGGETLIELLGSGEHGRWLIVHGHRHWPHLTYGPGGATSPVIFAAGSFSAVLYPELQSRARNQFYILDLPVQDYAAIGQGLVGEFWAWDWITNVGWQPAQEGSGLPHHGGFGSRQGGDLASDQIADAVTASGNSFMSWEQLCSQLGWLRYALPSDIALCVKHLQSKHGLAVLMDHGRPAQVGQP